MSAPRHFPPGFVGEVRHLTRQRLVPLIAHHVKLEKAGRDWKGCCPFHGEKTPSFYVYERRPLPLLRLPRAWRCHRMAGPRRGPDVQRRRAAARRRRRHQGSGLLGSRKRPLSVQSAKRASRMSRRSSSESATPRSPRSWPRSRTKPARSSPRRSIGTARRHGGTGTRCARSPKPRPIAPLSCAGIRPGARWSRSPRTPPAYRHPVR